MNQWSKKKPNEKEKREGGSTINLQGEKRGGGPIRKEKKKKSRNPLLRGGRARNISLSTNGRKRRDVLHDSGKKEKSRARCVSPEKKSGPRGGKI